MHEQSIVESLLALALENAEKAKASKIIRIYVVVGELSGVVEESVNFYFSFLCKDTIAAEASLFFMRTPARLRCRNCNTDFSPEKLNFHCPNCKEQQVEIIGGRELYIESMEVE
ncbi:MAG: hydrogenase maturation nickel metallochaperone HypA [Chloroflexi bacterium RBG_13_52_12]|nr:MAG: hydrogenase maturation nickel metallochaperone HypA [Chloroflexi bacterium RBG_13_52_12]